MIFLLFLKTMNCHHCSSFNLLETTENLTCLDCSRVQNYSLVESNDFSIPKVDYDFDLAEFFERSYFEVFSYCLIFKNFHKNLFESMNILIFEIFRKNFFESIIVPRQDCGQTGGPGYRSKF